MTEKTTAALVSADISNLIINNLLKLMLYRITLGDLVMCYTDEWPSINFMEVFSKDDRNEELYHAFMSEITDGDETHTDELLKKLFRPLVAQRLAETLGAKSVTIEW